MEIKVRQRSSEIMEVIFSNFGAQIEYDPMVFATINGRRERDVEDGFADTLLQAAVDVVEIRKRDTDTSEAIRRLFERLPGIKKDQLLSELVAEHTDLNESLESLQARIAELEARVAVYKLGEEE